VTDIALLERKLDDAVARLDRTRPFAKAGPAQAVIDLARRLMEAGGLERLDARIAAIDAAGVFAGTDWDVPSALLPNLVGNTLARGTPDQVTVEILSILRMLAIAEGRHRHPGMAPRPRGIS